MINFVAGHSSGDVNPLVDCSRHVVLPKINTLSVGDHHLDRLRSAPSSVEEQHLVLAAEDQ